jgi:hypothetical protein
MPCRPPPAPRPHHGGEDARSTYQQHDVLDRRRRGARPSGDAGEEDVGKLGERHRIASNGKGDDQPEREHTKRDEKPRKEAASHLLMP